MMMPRRFRELITILSMLCWSCAGASFDGPYDGVMNYPEVDAVSDLKDYQERSVSVVGRVSNVQWQHLITLVPTHPDTFYFDIGDYQIVVYTDTLPPDDVRLRIYGKVIEVRGSSNHGNTKVKDSYRVYHIIADGWEVLDG